VPSHQL
jgi:hypothetical protein